MARTASELADDLTQNLIASVEGLGEQIRTSAVSETRELLAQGLEDQFLQPGNRAQFGGNTPDELIMLFLGETELSKIPRLHNALVRFEEDGGVSEDFRAALLFAVQLIRDETYEF
ncbi:hypothetical protein DMP23_47425 [Amycolatopsis sp. A1MSW2902]|uniref:hypothetical protein n=1 Tax=Amycolatopsis sp. A1MSW2902 TaxID=687413 RepID=UPI00307E0C0C